MPLIIHLFNIDIFLFKTPINVMNLKKIVAKLVNMYELLTFKNKNNTMKHDNN